jgi:hypothetical protein
VKLKGDGFKISVQQQDMEKTKKSRIVLHGSIQNHAYWQKTSLKMCSKEPIEGI